MIIHEDGHTNIENNDALDNPENWKRQKIRGYFGMKFTLLLTNPPFGASVKEKEKSYLGKYELGGKIKKRNRQNTEILFIERCLDFLKPGGRMGIVLPDGILTNSSLQYVRDFINDKAQIMAVVSLPQAAFRRPASKGSGDTGSGVKASLLFLRKKKEGEKNKDYPIFMAIAEHIGYDATGRPDKDEFPDVLKAWREFRKTNRTSFFVKAPLCFAVGRGEIKGRIDPLYLKNILVTENIKTKYEEVTLNEILLSPPQYGANERAIDGDTQTDTRYIRITDIDEFGNLRDNDWKTAEHVEEKYILKENDILFARSGATAGKSFIFRKEYGKAIFAGYLIRFQINKAKADPSYVFYYTQCKRYSEWVKSIQRPSGQPNINSQEFKSFRIPLPPRDIQDKIASMMNGAYKARKRREAEANELLNSIEPYLSEQLGISREKFQTETPQVFSVTSDIVKGKHLSPFYYLFEVKKASVLKNVDYPSLKLEEVATINPKRKIEISLDALVAYIGLPETDESMGEVKNIINRPYRDVKGRGVTKKGDILFARIEPSIYNRKYIYVTDLKGDEFTLTSTEFYVVEPKGNINGNYLFYMLRSNFVYNQILGKITGTTGRRRLDIFAFRNILIPVPPLPIQEKIAYEVHNKREKAKKLKEEAKELLEKAKKEVEEFIEGKS